MNSTSGASARPSAPHPFARLSLRWSLRLGFLVSFGLFACGPSKARHDSRFEQTSDDLPAEFEATVLVDPGSEGVTLGEHAFGMHSSVYDNALQDAVEEDLKTRLAETGVRLLRWPGGGYSDNYHFATHSMTPFGNSGSRGYLAPRTDFGSFVGLLETVGAAAMITVNYGSNQNGDGPGEPKEAAAWVAYANGDPDDPTEIGIDSTGEDWKTIGYWASLRASEKLGSDEDGREHLRIGRREPLGIRYWEVGNELFGNGYYSAGAYEHDGHVPYDGTPRQGHPALSPTTYGKGVVEYVRAMKAVDPTIRVGAVLNTPPGDYSWGRFWNRDTLAECGAEIDFVMIHWYPSPPASGRGIYLFDLPRREIPAIREELEASFATCCSERTEPLEIAVTELGPNVSSNPSAVETALFSTEAYITFFEHGIFNVDWLELHNGSFLSERNFGHRGPAYKGLRIASAFVRPGDRFVQAESSLQNGVRAHAAVRPDGSVAVLLINLTSESQASARVEIGGPALSENAERYDYTSSGSDGQVSGPTPMTVANVFSLVIAPRSMVTVTIPKSH
jgi:hypothetical protein